MIIIYFESMVYVFLYNILIYIYDIILFLSLVFIQVHGVMLIIDAYLII